MKDRATPAVATDSITTNDRGCTLIEKWRDASGNEGLSVFMYQPAQQSWLRNTLIRSSVVLAFEGRMADGSISMTATQYLPSGLPELHRIRFTPKTDGTIEEVWLTSTDLGKSWETRFDEVFTRIGE